ncbi:hypothetical protein BDN67DRAFT_965851 [Paxillus ammoniavirescens]|nr:hypothetical protein BDN67DRAFT_965851 [Paxillus ammoniavirescens]
MSYLKHYAACDDLISEPNDNLRLDREMNDTLAYHTQTTDAFCTSTPWDNNYLSTGFPESDWMQDPGPLPQAQIDPWPSHPHFQSSGEDITNFGFELPSSNPLVSHLPSVAGSDMVQANNWHFDAPFATQPDVHSTTSGTKYLQRVPSIPRFRGGLLTPFTPHPRMPTGEGTPNLKTHPLITHPFVCPSMEFPSDSWGGLPPSPSGGPQTHECQWAADDGTWCRALVQGNRREVMLHLNEKHGIPLTGDKTPQTCLWQGCRSTMQRESIPRHIVAVHMKERVHCTKCRSSFARNDSLQRHLKGGKEETCNGKPGPQRGCQPIKDGAGSDEWRLNPNSLVVRD